METEIGVARKKLWILSLFCCVGWILFLIGCSGQYLEKGFAAFLIIFGILVAGAPSILSVYQHGFFESFRTDTIIEITVYADNRKEVNVDWATTLLFRIIFIVLTVFCGVAITPIRIVIGLFGLRKAMLNGGYTKEEAFKAILPPFITCASSFVGGIIIATIMFNVISPAVIKNRHPKSELTAEETIDLGIKVKEAHKLDSDYYYKVDDVVYYRSQKGNELGYVVEVEGNVLYYIVNGQWYDSNENKIEETKETKKYGKHFLEGKWDYDLMISNPETYYVSYTEPYNYGVSGKSEGKYTIGQFRKNQYDIEMTVSEIDYRITYFVYEKDYYYFFERNSDDNVENFNPSFMDAF